MHRIMGDLRIDGGAMRYSQFVPRLYNYCLSLGFRRGHMMPSRAFSSDESQGYPVILLTQHFGTFPFDHGRVGGKVATDRHGPFAHHGEDLMIVQASHVGYDAERQRFGVYRRHLPSIGRSKPCRAKTASNSPMAESASGRGKSRIAEPFGRRRIRNEPRSDPGAVRVVREIGAEQKTH